MKRKITVTIVGLGARGKETYGTYINTKSQNMEIVAICESDELKLKKAQIEYGLDDEFVFDSTDKLFEKGKISDAIIIANYDQDHFNATIKAIHLGYDILLEKPISNQLSECIKIRDEALKYGVSITVCHVMRYTSYYMYLKKLLKEQTIGSIIAIEQTEDVSYWHMAHAFVRGNFRSSLTTSPMILQKCCHDMDLIVYLTDAKPKSVYSVGSLRYFKKENAPLNSSDRCIDCKVDCPFNANKFYLKTYEDNIKHNRPVDVWPLSQVCHNPNFENITEAMKTTRWGKCVFKCDNDVVDHQFSTITFENGVVATLTMIGFSNEGGRQTHVYGTNGEIYLDEQRRTIEVSVFGSKKKIISFDSLSDDFSGHGGGDNEMMKEFENCLLNPSDTMSSSIEKSVDSHLLCFASEKSRISNGKMISIKNLEEEEKN